MLLKSVPPGGTLPGRASCHPAGGTTVNATRPGPLWQAQLDPYAPCFTRPGFRDFAIWGTGLALNVEEHTITQSLVALDRPQDWKALEAFAEHGAWDEPRVERTNARALEDAPGRIWHGFRVWAGDDTKVHRSSPDVWGTCTFHEYTARCPNRAATVRAHNWVVLGALVPGVGHRFPGGPERHDDGRGFHHPLDTLRDYLHLRQRRSEFKRHRGNGKRPDVDFSNSEQGKGQGSHRSDQPDRRRRSQDGSPRVDV